ncbi:exo-alpha-sialidase, partial [candidate division KSB1 bacterium]|nr:exo-alpha-sialidase [candidate division KSB1 bacterium]
MKLQKVLAISGFATALCVIITIYFLKSDYYKPKKTHPVQFEASEGTKEDPSARARHKWDRLLNPITNEIPINIGRKEIAFVNKLAEQTSKTHHSLTNEWVSRGPYHIGGRTKALALDILNENIILAGCVSSGMWKSIDGGGSWTKTTAPDQLHSVSCISQNKASGKEHIWYYGTGEYIPGGRGGSASGIGGTDAYYRGDGIFKSVDNGNTWSQLESTVSGTADETDPFDFIWNIATFGERGVYAATSSGLFKSTDEGESWDHVLDFGNNDPLNNTYPSTEIAITSQGTCYATIGGIGPDNGIYQCVDGETWEDISPVDWPDTTSRTVIGIAPSDENIVYFFTEVIYFKQQLRKYEKGVGWTDLTEFLPFNAEMQTYGGNMFIIYVKPDNANTIFLGTIGLYRSINGGQSFELIGGYSDFHVDQHSIAFYPSDPKAMIVGNDGGLFKTSNNMAETELDLSTGEYHIDWESLNNGYLTTQFYTVSIDHGTQGSETISGGMQDNGCMFSTSSNPQDYWEDLVWGDGGFTAIADGGETHYTAQAATFNLHRHSFPNGEHQITEITPASGRMGLWLTIFMLDPHDQKIMYVPSQTDLWRNSDLTEIPHIIPRKRTDVNWSRLENVKDYYIHALGMSKAEPRRLYYAGSWTGGYFYDERVFYIDNPHIGQPVPVEVTGENFPSYPDCPQIHCIAVDPIDANKVIVIFPNYGVISIYASEDGGDNWSPVSGNLEENPDGTGCGPSVRWVSILYVEDKPIYFAGTSVGLFSTTRLDSMNTIWVQEGAETIGNVVVDMIDVRHSDGFVAVGTHGNGVYSTTVAELPSGLENITTHPESFKFYPAYPNPINSSTTIRFLLPKPRLVRMTVYNIL